MEHPPLIDVEPEDEKVNRAVGCLGCLGRIIPVATIGLALLIGVMWLGLFIWGGKPGDELPIDESVLQEEAGAKDEKKGLAGVMDKVKRAIKGEAKSTPTDDLVEGEAGETEAGEAAAAAAATAESTSGGVAEQTANAVEKSAQLAEAVGAEAKTPEERNRLLKEKFGHLEEDRSAGSADGGANLARESGTASGGRVEKVTPEALGSGNESAAEMTVPLGPDGEPLTGAAAGGRGSDQEGSGPGSAAEASLRGGSRGDSEGAVAVSAGQSRNYMKSRGNFKTAGSDLTYELIYQESGGQLHYRFFLVPYDSQVNKMFQADKGELSLVFAGAQGERLLPVEEALSLPLSTMTAFEARGEVSGWVARGIIPIGEQNLNEVTSIKLGWDFDEALGDLLKDVTKNRARQPSR